MVPNNSIAYLSLGSNIGDRKQFLSQAITLLANHSNITIQKKSYIYETEPYGVKEQDRFLNMAISIFTDLSPEDLLTYIQQVEKLLHRERFIHWGPRTIDIDILMYDDKIINLPHLKIPHPYLVDRLFVLMPLNEIYQGLIPGQSKSIQEFISNLEGEQGIELYEG